MHRNLLTGPSLPFLYYAAGRERKEDGGGGPLSLRGKSEMAVPPEYVLYILYTTQFPGENQGTLRES